jgi:hypothetical protein
MAGLVPAIPIECLLTRIASFATSVRVEMAGTLPAMTALDSQSFRAWYYTSLSPLARAIDQVNAWLESPTLELLTESATHWATLRTLLVTGRVAGGLVHGRHHDVRELWSADRDFGRFTGVTVVNPLVGDR